MDASQLEASGGCEVTLAILPNKDKTVAIQTLHPLHMSQFEAVLDMAQSGCFEIYEKIHSEVKSYLVKQHTVMTYR